MPAYSPSPVATQRCRSGERHTSGVLRGRVEVARRWRVEVCCIEEDPVRATLRAVHAGREPQAGRPGRTAPSRGGSVQRTARAACAGASARTGVARSRITVRDALRRAGTGRGVGCALTADRAAWEGAHVTLDFDALSRSQLSRPTSRKWSLEPGTIGAWVAEMDFGTAPEVQEAIEAGVRDRLFGYLTPATAREAADATSDWSARQYGWRPDPRRIHSVTDVLSALELAIRHFSRPRVRRDRADARLHAVRHPPAHARATAAAGAGPVRRRPLDASTWEAAGRGLRIRRAAPSCSANPHNPTGRRAGPCRAGGDRGGGRAARRPRVRRPGPCADPVRGRAHPVREPVRGDGGAHGDRDERVEGLEHPRAEGRAADPVRRAARAAVPGRRPRASGRAGDPRRRGRDRGLPARRASGSPR